MTSTVKLFDQPDQRAAWDRLASAAPGNHILQNWAWGELKACFGWRVQRLAVGDACAQVLYRSLPGGLGTIAYIPKGPLLDYDDIPSLQLLLNAIQSLAREHRAIALKIEPNAEDSPALAQGLRSLGFQPSLQAVQPRRTILVDLDGQPDDLLRQMKQKTRYNVRLAQRRGVTIRRGDEADLPAFYHLMEMTALRDGFSVHSQAYYETAHRLFVPAGRGNLLLAEVDGQLVAGLVVLTPVREDPSALTCSGTACYMYGASSDEHRNLMPTYLLQWEAMLWAREQGCRDYDLWGVPDEDQEALEAGFTRRNDGLWGVYRFKRGFGGRLMRTIGAWDLVYAPLRYRLYAAAVDWLQKRRGG